MEQKTCITCSGPFTIFDEDKRMLEKLSSKVGGKVYALPLPEKCPFCRMQQRNIFRNERVLYKRTCDMCHKQIFASYHQESPFVVYCADCWQSDKWDPLSFGQDVDFERPVFEQIQELFLKVPQVERSVVFGTQENSDFTNSCMNLKNCYLVFNANNAEDSLYSKAIPFSKNCVDCHTVPTSEYCYGCVDCEGCYSCSFVTNSLNCTESMFCDSCISCTNCMFCFNLQRREYCIFNTQYTKEEYEKMKAQFDIGNYEVLQKAWEKFQQESVKYPKKAMRGNNNQNVHGNYISNSKDVWHSFDIFTCENVRYCNNLKSGAKDFMDVSFLGIDSERCYSCTEVGVNAYNCIGTAGCYENVSDTMYSINCRKNIAHVFGCVGLQGKSYCILNKQYTKEEYEDLVPRTIEHMMNDGYSSGNAMNPSPSGTSGSWGQFFPASLSPFGYNEAITYDYDQLSKEEALARGYTWQDDMPAIKGKGTCPAEKLPLHIKDTSEDILKEILTCISCESNYRIIPQEYAFLLKHNIAVPRECFSCRHMKRHKQRHIGHMYDRHCDSCQKEIQSSYAPEEDMRIYCDDIAMKGRCCEVWCNSPPTTPYVSRTELVSLPFFPYKSQTHPQGFHKTFSR